MRISSPAGSSIDIRKGLRGGTTGGTLGVYRRWKANRHGLKVGGWGGWGLGEEGAMWRKGERERRVSKWQR